MVKHKLTHNSNGGKIAVLRDFVAIKKTEPTKSGLIEIVRLDQRLQTGVIVEVGTGVLAPNGEQHPIGVSIGDEVVFDKMSSIEIEHRGEKFLIVNELSIRAVLLPEVK